MQQVKIAIAQTNMRVGDISGNTGLIIKNTDQARRLGADIIIFPELSLIGYPPEDLLLRKALYNQSGIALKKICGESEGIDVLLGHARNHNRKFYNSCSLIRNGHIEMTYDKQKLPNYGVFDEKRYFSPGNEIHLFDLKGIPVAVSICEDIWDEEVCIQARDKGARLLLNLNASPYHIDKMDQRKSILKQRVSETGLNIVYVNLTGGQDELVFDGGSMAISSDGNIEFEAPQFREDLYLLEFSLDDNRGSFWLTTENTTGRARTEELIYTALVCGVRDYVKKNGFNGALIGLSGGIDSALTLAIAVDALGKDNVEAVIMPSRYTAAISTEDAEEMARGLGLRFHVISIEEPFSSFVQILKPAFADKPADITEENIQARCRGVILMAISNKSGKLVLTTGNKSEMAVGYATLYGDMAGSFAPLKDLYKTQVYKLCNWRNLQSPAIPQRIIDRPPTAELREGQLDQDSLPPYELLDPILEKYIEQDYSPAEIIELGSDEEVVKKVVLMVDRNEYKRRQSAPGIRITQRAFGRDRRYPITSGYRE